MIRKVPILILVSIALMILIGACTLSGSSAPTPLSPEALTEQAVIATEAKETVVAPLTEVPSATASSDSDQPAAITATSQPQPTAKPTEPKTTDAPQASNTPASTAVPTATPTKTPLPTATFAPSDIRSRLGEPSIVENFDDTGPYNWYTYEDERVKFQAADGKLNMTAFEPNNELGWALAPMELAASFYIEMDYTPGICAERDRYGMIVSPTRSANRGYMFDFSCDGRYSLWIWNGVSEKVTSLIPWTESEYIRPGANRLNRLGILIEVDKMYIYANGHLINQVTNDVYDKIYIGFMVGGQTTKNFTVVSNQMNYWILK